MNDRAIAALLNRFRKRTANLIEQAGLKT